MDQTASSQSQDLRNIISGSPILGLLLPTCQCGQVCDVDMCPNRKENNNKSAPPTLSVECRQNPNIVFNISCTFLWWTCTVPKTSSQPTVTATRFITCVTQEVVHNHPPSNIRGQGNTAKIWFSQQGGQTTPHHPHQMQTTL
eukprot:TRINITY_DN65535_c12_g4_i1.p1 TRINITY_DN65535_c12_g4~~TRINITY_DN65535_c12_g4_i1.p1  ORF type:complete len:142 (-),score=16.06 TRINITY_DN65535_c12_g4_i1:1-426(-)